MASFLTAAAAAIGSSSIGSALVRILVAYGVSRLINKSTGQDNGAGAVDQGVRLQAAPDTTNPIPLLYGSAYLGGKITDAQLTDANQTMWYCLTLSEVPTAITTRLSDGAAITTSVDEIYWNNQRVYFKADGVTVDYLVNQDGIVDTSPRDLVKIYLYGNGSFNPMLPSDLGEYISPLPSVPGDARAVFPAWDNTFRMAGLTFALVKVSYNRDKGITGLPELQFKVSNNLFKPGDAIYSFLTNPISGADLSATEIDTASLIALNDYADDEVNYIDETDGLTYQLGDRYQINGIVNPGNNVLDNLTALANNCGAFVNYDIARGLWGVKINRDTVTALAFDDSNIISGIDLTGTALDNMYNSVIVEFPHRQLRDQIDTIRIDLPDEFRNANEPDNTLNIRLDLLNEPLQARELAYLELYQNRMDRVITFTTDYSKINAEAGDVITVTNSIYGFVNQPFKIVRVREIEAEAGGIAVEITAQEYDATMYTAGGQPRRPRVPSVPITIPEITVIGTPAAPTVVQLNNVAVPALDITGLTPSGIVDRFEFWYSNDAGVTYKVLGSRSNSNGSPYNQNTSLTFRAASLPAGTYLFKVRGGNENAFGDFSPASTSVVWAPVQVTDQVTEDTTIGGSMADLIGPLAMGAVAYFAYQALYPEIMKALGDSELGSIFGIPTSAVQEMKNAAGNFKLVQVGDVIQTPYNNDTITFVAGDGIEITAEADAGTITISSNANVNNETEVKSNSGGFSTTYYEPSEYSDGISRYDKITKLTAYGLPYKVNHSAVDKNCYFTHHMLVFGHPPIGDAIYSGTRSQTGAGLAISVKQDGFIPLKNGTLKYLNGIDSTWNRVYTICTYDSSKSLEQQAWGTWKTWGSRIISKSHIRKTYTETNPSASSTYAVLPPSVPNSSVLCAFTNEDNNTLNKTGNEETGTNVVLYSNVLNDASGFEITVTSVDSNGAITGFTWTTPTNFSYPVNWNTGPKKLRTLRGTGKNATFTITGTPTAIISVTLNNGGSGYNNVNSTGGSNTTQCYNDSYSTTQTWNTETEGITIQPGEIIMFGLHRSGYTPASTAVFGNTVFSRMIGSDTSFSYLESASSTVSKTINELTWHAPLNGSLIVSQPNAGDWSSTSVTTSSTSCPF
jgi:hypothetical protein